MSKPNSEVMAIILAGGKSERLSVFTEKSALPSLPFAGKFRIIDFTLSNCVNSGLDDIMLLTQYRPLSLNEHIGNGKPWDLDRQHGGVRIVSPYLGRKEGGWDKGTADAVYQNIEELLEENSDNVLILAGDHIYKMDYSKMLNFHLENKADATIAVIEVPAESASRYGIISVNKKGEVEDFEEKPRRPRSNLASMGIYIFNKEVLISVLNRDAGDPNSQHDFGRNIIPLMLDNGNRVMAYAFKDYWRDVGTVQSYWEAHMELLESPPRLDLYERDWVIYTRSQERPPAIVSSKAHLERSLISHGCQVRGTVIHSVLSPGVIVEEGAVVRDSVIMGDAVIGKNSVLDHVIVDSEAVIGANSLIGYGEDNTQNKLEPRNLHTGITVIGSRAHLPEGVKIGRNCKVGHDLRPENFGQLELPSGGTIEAR
ncbi:MAG: glucose-1-phosphate adenylyltransferase [Chloroflexi bacterium]|uniref:Glucose-1-phosphate adenylyltransferase n=1 Tax=Candidatus Chlorohelix allophototropha TaxID=3003348 RepID=A0A8T7M416_9CHLR|nr:glucose-1-phosphate adenylyltransferase [Chloroflexota bacterium]WJW70185.1 glucose-1-phosphate adenylyltransferase [Chloroflexota bacterium L227-S17]